MVRMHRHPLRPARSDVALVAGYLRHLRTSRRAVVPATRRSQARIRPAQRVRGSSVARPA
jgi:hypothetical protein